MTIDEISLAIIMERVPMEGVTVARHSLSGAISVIALASTKNGPAIGGTRIRNYAHELQGVMEACLLAQAMTRKAAMAKLPHGGGKAVILSPDDQLPQDYDDPRRADLLTWFGQRVEGLKGQYITCEDSGTSSPDMRYVRSMTQHVVGVPEDLGGYGDPSPFTADGVVHSIRYTAERLLGTSLSQIKVAVQGVGHVGKHIVAKLVDQGAKVVLCDLDQSKINDVMASVAGRADVVGANEIADVPADIFCPCAFGQSVTEAFARTTEVKAVVGAANNQLASPLAGQTLFDRGIFYGPDYVVNAGGLILMAAEANRWTIEEAHTRVAGIADSLHEVFQHSKEHGIPMNQAADEMADSRVPD